MGRQVQVVSQDAVNSRAWGDKLLIAPSLLSANPLAVGESIRALKGNFDWLHVDVMDGHFVPNLSYGPAIVKALRKAYADILIDVHIMVERAEDFLDMFLNMPAEQKPGVLTVHAEATKHLHRVLARIRESGVLAGVAMNPATPLEFIAPVLHMADVVLVMSVNPGFGGQHFIAETLDKCEHLCQLRAAHGYKYMIEIDGGIGEVNIQQVRASGVNVAVAGSAVFGAEDPFEAVIQLRQLAEESDRMKTGGGE